MFSADQMTGSRWENTYYNHERLVTWIGLVTKVLRLDLDSSSKTWDLTWLRKTWLVSISDFNSRSFVWLRKSILSFGIKEETPLQDLRLKWKLSDRKTSNYETKEKSKRRRQREKPVENTWDLPPFTTGHPTLTWQQFWRRLCWNDESKHSQPSPLGQLEATTSSLPASIFPVATFVFLTHSQNCTIMYPPMWSSFWGALKYFKYSP